MNASRYLLIKSLNVLSEALPDKKSLKQGTTLYFTGNGKGGAMSQLKGNPCKYIQHLEDGTVKVKMGQTYLDGIASSDLAVASGQN